MSSIRKQFSSVCQTPLGDVRIQIRKCFVGKVQIESQDREDVIKTGVEGKQDSTVPFFPKMCFPEFIEVWLFQYSGLLNLRSCWSLTCTLQALNKPNSSWALNRIRNILISWKWEIHTSPLVWIWVSCVLASFTKLSPHCSTSKYEQHW